MRTLVEKMIPARILTQYGIYLQTWAHIEYACWTIYRLADPEAKRFGEDISFPVVEAKRTTRGLLKKFKSSANQCSPHIKLRILMTYRRITNGLETRNTASHGVFFFDDKTDSLRLEHFFIRKSDPKETWRYFEDPISQTEIDEALEEADLILRELVNIRSEIEADRK
tara:strand:- start:341 stop:844 length:504 start_codon:yes stop_codon:yes gene_type:complete